MTGIRVTQIPHQFRRRTGRWLVIQGTQFTSLSSIIDAIMVGSLYPKLNLCSPHVSHRLSFMIPPRPLLLVWKRLLLTTPIMVWSLWSRHQALKVGDRPGSGLVLMVVGADTCPPLVVGDYANKVVRDKSFTINTEDLSFFKELVVAVVR